MSKKKKNTSGAKKEVQPHFSESLMRNLFNKPTSQLFGENDLFSEKPTPEQVIKKYEEKARQKYNEEILSHADNTIHSEYFNYISEPPKETPKRELPQWTRHIIAIMLVYFNSLLNFCGLMGTGLVLASIASFNDPLQSKDTGFFYLILSIPILIIGYKQSKAELDEKR